MTAVGSIESVRAEAHIALVDRVDAGSAVQAWVVRARLLRRSFAALSVETGWAIARRIRLTLVGE